MQSDSKPTAADTSRRLATIIGEHARIEVKWGATARARELRDAAKALRDGAEAMEAVERHKDAGCDII